VTDIWKKSRLNCKLKISNMADNADTTQSWARDTRHRRMQEVYSLCMDSRPVQANTVLCQYSLLESGIQPLTCRTPSNCLIPKGTQQSAVSHTQINTLLLAWHTGIYFHTPQHNWFSELHFFTSTDYWEYLHIQQNIPNICSNFTIIHSQLLELSC